MIPESTRRLLAQSLLLLVVLVTGLVANRLLFELFFPTLAWIGRPLPALIFSIIFVVLARWLWRRLAWPVVPLLPLLLNAFSLLPTDLNPTRTAVILAASVWLTAVCLLAYPHLTQSNDVERLSKSFYTSWLRRGPLLLVAALLPVYLLTVSHAVGRADTFEFQVVAPQLGIAHPTGYPLFLLLGKLFTYLPLSTVAWRLNFAATLYGLVALSLLFVSAYWLLKRPLPALLGVVLIGLTPSFWRESIEAEVYTLHAIFVAVALWLTLRLLGFGGKDVTRRDTEESRRFTARKAEGLISDAEAQRRRGIKRFSLRLCASALSNAQITIALAFTIGLGLTNHLTTLFLLPPAGIGVLLLSYGEWQRNGRLALPLADWRYWLKLAAAFLLPLTLYAYLPIRWWMLHNESMGLARFLDWTTGGRFQDALQWRAWLDDPTRYEVIAQLFRQNWGELNLLLALVGFAFLLWKQWRAALILFALWLGYTFYSLNYYVPDLDVFILPAQLMVGLFWAAGLVALLALAEWLSANWSQTVRRAFNVGLVVTAVIPALLLFVDNWPRVDQSSDDGLLGWGAGVLAMPLDQNAAILADSEKIAPLYYLQQAEGVRPDLNIMVLPDEVAYRQELTAQLAAGRTVYLARYLPGLQGSYHLRSVGPLVEVATVAKTAVPPSATPASLTFDDVALVGHEIEQAATVDAQATAVTLYWQSLNDSPAPHHVYIRWQGDNYTSPPVPATGQYPVDNMYPANAWKGDEIVVDYHLLPQPVSPQPHRLAVQVAVAPAFTAATDLDWQTVTDLVLSPTPPRQLPQPLRAQLGPVFLDGLEMPGQVRPLTALPLTVSGYGPANLSADDLVFTLDDQPFAHASPETETAESLPFVLAQEIEVGADNGRFSLSAYYPGQAAYCGWLRPATHFCVLGQFEVSGVPLPEGAINFNDQIALLDITVEPTALVPGGLLDVVIHWQSLAPMGEDYTVFVQVLDAQDRIVGQVDAWPRQGTYPTSQWSPGETVRDPYQVWLDGDLPPGDYRLQVGWYLLATLRRLPLLDVDGVPVDDKVIYPGLIVVE
jgi:hypothetical protein